MKVKVKKTHPDAKIPFKTYEDDFCYDCVATSCEEIAPNVYKYGIGLAFQIDRDEQNLFCHTIETKKHIIRTKLEAWQLSIDFRPRSSVWKTGMVLSNCIGTVDELFIGEVSAVYYHLFTNMPKYEVGDKIGQIKLGFTLPMDFVEVDELDPTERGENSYGSTDR